MTIKSDFKAAALEIFDEFVSVNIAATYVEKPTGYTAGGSLGGSDTNYSVRVIRDTSQSAYDSLGVDVGAVENIYMMLYDELPVTAKVKDSLIVAGETKTIIALSVDPAEAVILIAVGSSYTKGQL